MDKHARETYLTLVVAVAIPLLQALVSGVLLGIAVGAVAQLLGASAAFVTGLIAFALISAVAWMLGLLWWRRMISDLESMHAVIDYSQLEPEYLPEPESVRIELVQDGGRSGAYIHLPCSPDKLRSFAHGLADGKSFTEAAWCGGATPLFTRAEFCQLRDEMLRRGLLEQNSPSTPARGYRLTRGGEACIRYLANTAAPLLQSSGVGAS